MKTTMPYLVRTLSVVFLCSFFGAMAVAQNLSNKGKDFWVAYGHHQFMEPNGSPQNGMDMVIYLSAEQPATVTVTVDSSGSALGLPPWKRTYNIPANTVIASDLIPKAGTYDARLYTCPPGFGLPTCTGGEGLFRYKGIHIESDVPIVAYAHIYGQTSSGATMLMPTDTWGYSYTSVNSRQTYANNCYSWMYVIAQKDNTVVQIIPSQLTRNGSLPNSVITATLMKGQIYQIVGANPSNGPTALELTGTTVKSIANSAGQCYPIAVFSGSSRTANPADACGSGGGDNDNQQLFPYQAWGKRYLTAPTSGSTSPNGLMTNMYKIAVRDPLTVVKKNGIPFSLAALTNSCYYYESNTADLIESDKPVMVAQFMTGGSGCINGGLGDPEMMYISPVEQAIPQVGFFRNNQESIQVNYLTLIVPNGGTGLSSLTIDGQPLSVVPNNLKFVYTHPQLPGYSVVVRKWNVAARPAPPPGQCIVKSDSAFTAVTYGLGSAESYGYNAGTLINNLAAVGSIRNELDTTVKSHPFTCTKTPVELSVLMAYKPTRMVWLLSQQPALSPNADVTVNNPQVVDSAYVKGVKYYKYTLPGFYTFSSPGIFNLSILSTHPSIENCNNTEELKIQVEVKATPVADFTYTHTGCAKDTVVLTAAGSDGTYTIKQWAWFFPDATKDSVQVVKHLLAGGVQPVKLVVISTEGCLSDTTTKNITVLAPPTSAISITPTALCLGDTFAIKDNSSFGGTGAISSWYWDFGNGPGIAVTADTVHHITYNSYGTYQIRHVAKLTATCIGDTAVSTVTVYAKPVPSFNYPAGCLPVNGIVQFTSTTTTPDAQTITAYSWDFGDPAATPGNPNTSTAADPSHTYSNYGNYDIKYKATTANGCSKDTLVKATFSLKPLLTFTALTPVCASIKGTVSVAKGGVANGVTGTGIYKGPGTNAAGDFSPSVAGAGTHTIWYVYKATSGCTDSISTTITVYPKPTPAFTVATDICLNQAATITDQSTIASGTITGWNWNFGDNTTASYTSNNVFSKSYSTYSTYAIKLSLISDQGCLSDTLTATLNVHPLPAVDFNLPVAVCMPGGEAAFVNKTTIPDQSALSYTWNFGDNSATVSQKDATHNYAATGIYTVELKVVSADGCSAIKQKVLSDFYDKPVADFMVAPDTLCQGSDNVFTDQSTAPNNAITGWNWRFGDNSSATTQNPVKQYTSPGEYTVELTVTNAVGCKSDVFTHDVVVYLQPVIDAGPSFTIPQGTVIRFNPKVNDSTVLQFEWSPASDFADATVLRPVLKAMHDQVYTLTAIGEHNCSATDDLKVKILKPVKIPNAFSPNRDGVNDVWELSNLADYPGCTVDVYNRYGQRVFQSEGYLKPWDGTYNGNPLPMATYYYVIHLRNGFQPLSGSVTIIK